MSRAAAHGGWRARPRVEVDRLAEALRDGFLKAGMAPAEKGKPLIRLPVDETTGLESVNIQTLEMHFELLQTVFERFPHPAPCPRQVEAAWAAASRRMYRIPSYSLIREESDLFWDSWSYAWMLTRRSKHNHSKSVKVARLKQLLRAESEAVLALCDIALDEPSKDVCKYVSKLRPSLAIASNSNAVQRTSYPQLHPVKL